MKLLSALFFLIESLLRIVYEAIFGGDARADYGVGYNAQFINESELLSSSNSGFCINGEKSLTREVSYRNLLISATTGSGKSTVTIIPSILKINNASLVVHDPSGELFNNTAQSKISQGYKVYILNFGNPNISAGYNPLFYAKNINDINKISNALVRGSVKNTSDDFWNIQAVSIISIMISILKTQPTQYVNLFNVRYLISILGSEPDKVDKLFAKHASPILLTEYKNLISYDSKVLASIIASAQASLQLFVDEQVSRITSIHQIDFEKIRKEKSIIYIQNATSDILYYKPIISLVFEQLFRILTVKLPEKKDLDLFFLIDEFSSLTLPSIPIFLSNCRKYRIGVALSVQNLSQMANFYGKENSDTIYSNCITKLFFSGQALNDAVMLENVLGKMEVIDEEGKMRVMPLMTSENLRTMNPEEAIIVSGSLKPIKVQLTPFYKSFWLKLKTEQKPPVFNNKDIPEQVPLLSLD